MSIRLSKKGCAAYIIALISAVVFASFYGGLLPFLLLYAVLLLIPVSIIYIVLNYRFLSVYQELDSHRIVKGESHDFTVSLDNTGILPIHDMKMILHSDRCDFDAIRDKAKISLKAKQSVKLKAKAVCLYGGAYDVGLKSVGFSDPFGIIGIELNVPYTFRAVVAPKITEIAGTYMDIENLRNSIGMKSTVNNEEIPGNDMRLYVPGDPIRSINWKVSARLDKYVVRIPDRMDTRRITLILEPVNMSAVVQDTEFLRRRDYFLEFCVSAAWYFASRGLPVKIVYPSGKITEKQIDSHESFREFYIDVAGGMIYRSEDERDRMHKLAQERRQTGYGEETNVIICEDEWPGEDFCTVAG
jgi:uncharacterized protein (DUF58 family)